MTFKKLAAAFATVVALGITGVSAQQSTAAEKCKAKGWTVGPSEAPLDIVIPFTDLKIEDKKNAQLFDAGVCSIILEAPASPLKDKNDIPGDEPTLNGFVVVEVPLSDIEQAASHSMADKHLLEFSVSSPWRNAAKAASDKDAPEAAVKKIGDKLQGQMRNFAHDYIEAYTRTNSYIGIHARVSGVSFAVVPPSAEVVEAARAKVEAEKAAKEAQKAAEKAEKERQKKEKKDNPDDSSQTPSTDPFGIGADNPMPPIMPGRPGGPGGPGGF